MLGISIYPEKAKNEKEILDYIDLAHKYGYKKLFTCMMSASAKDVEGLLQEFNFCKYARDLGFEVAIDVNPIVLEQYGLKDKKTEFLKDLGSTVVRLDEGFNGKTEADMTYNKEGLIVEINMSADTAYLNLINDYIPKKNMLQGTHNFYPQKYSGLELDYFLQCSKRFNKLNMRTGAFIGDKNAPDGAWDINDNAVTLEMHRELDVVTQLKHFYAIGVLDDYLLSTQFSSEETLKKLSELDDSVMEFKIELLTNHDISKEILFENEHFRRGDINKYTARSSLSRIKYKDYDFKLENTSKQLKRGDVVICNNNFGKYKGELQVIMNDMEDVNEERNVVGRIIKEEHMLLDYLKPWQRFKFDK